MAGATWQQTRHNDFNGRGFQIIEALDRVAQQRDTSPVKIAPARLISHAGINAPIASAAILEQLHE